MLAVVTLLVASCCFIHSVDARAKKPGGVDMERMKQCEAAEDCIRAGKECQVNDGNGGTRNATADERRKISDWYHENCTDAPLTAGVGGVMQ